MYICALYMKWVKNKTSLSPRNQYLLPFGGDVAQLRKHGIESLSLKPDWFRCVKSAACVKENS